MKIGNQTGVVCAMIATLLFATVSSASNAQQGEVVTSRVPAKIHVIQNLEGWNDVQIRLSGILRNSCFSKGETTVKVEGDQILIENLIKHQTGTNCLAVLTPYGATVEVRDLKEGTYDVSVRDKFGEYQDMTSFKTE